VVGSIVTFVGQSLTRRQTSALSVAQQKADLRRDRREGIYAFLEAAQRVYALSTTQAKEDRQLATDKTIGAEAELLFRQKCMDVVCGPELRSAATEYARVLIDTLSGFHPEGMKIEEYIANAEYAFFDLARQELYAPKVSD
jgi:hypothetical protein